MNFSSSRSWSGERLNKSSRCSIKRLSGTRPRSYFAFASGRVLPPSVTNLLSSTVCVIRTGRTFQLARREQQTGTEKRAQPIDSTRKTFHDAWRLLSGSERLKKNHPVLSKSESPFWFKNGTDHIPIPLFADSVKHFSYEPPQRSENRARTAEIARYSAIFATLLLPPTRCRRIPLQLDRHPYCQQRAAADGAGERKLPHRSGVTAE